MRLRLNLALVQAGLAGSRRAADELVAAGRVRLNGHTIRAHSTSVAPGDELQVDGRQVSQGPLPPRVVVLLNKPVGYACTHRVQPGQRSIFELLPPDFASLKLAGRLDIDSAGLVVLSNDGRLIQALSHPRHTHQKTYRVTTREAISSRHLTDLQQPILLDGKSVQAQAVRQINQHELELTITQGRNRQVRRMCGRAGLTVTQLTRTAVGPYQLGRLQPGQWRQITEPPR